MSIWAQRSSTSASGRGIRLGARTHRTARRRMLAATVSAMSVFALITSAPADAVTPTVTLTDTVTPGSATVSFTASIGGAVAGDSAYVCFGDEAAGTCDGAHAGTAVDVTAASAPAGTTLSHQYPAEGSFTAMLFEVQPGTPATVTASGPTVVAVTIDGTARLTHTVTGLSAVFDGSASTAATGDTWWACFGETATCTATTPDASGTVSGGNPPLAQVSHTYAAPGTYPASLTVVGTAVTTTAASPTTVNFPHPTAVLSAGNTSGSGNLPVIFDGSKSVVAAGDSWQFCYGDVASCSQATPDATGLISTATPTVSLSTTAHNYPPGTYTATLWLVSGTTTTKATVAITVTNPIAGPDSTCTLSNGTRTCTLFAKGNGSVTAGSGTARKTIPFWGFTLSDTATPVLGGPELVATEGEKLAFTVRNELDPRAGNVSITVPDLIGSPDPTGVAPGATGASNPTSGPFTLTRPGTYIYEAGLTAGGARQVAMGLSGVLIVRPSVPVPSSSARCAYDAAVNADCVTNKDANNYFDREKLVVVNELDADYNADPFKADTGDYHPTNYFIDGVAYDSAKAALDPSALAFDPAVNNVRLDAARGDTVLLRYADLGLREHSMNVLGLAQTETARDAHQLPGAQVHATEFLNAGETSDAFVTIPADTSPHEQFPILDAGLHLNNGEAGGLGGMYTYLDVINGVTAADLGPVGSAATVTPTFSASAPNVDNGQVPALQVSGTFTAQPTSTGATPTVASVQWALDGVPGTGGLWQQPSAAPVPPGSPTASFSFAVNSDLLTQLLGAEPDRVFGDHTVWMQAIDSNGQPGPAIGATFTMARRDAVITGLSIDPAVTNGNTASTQGPVASTTISSVSNGQAARTATTLNVKSTAGFPASCPTPESCAVTVRLTLASGPAAGDTVTGLFYYTGLTPTSFTGLSTTDLAVTSGLYVFATGSTVAFDTVPAGYIAVVATATSSLPGWVISDAQACVVNAGSGTAPVAADAAKCGSAAGPTTDFPVGNPDSMVPVNGFVAPPVLPTATPDGARYWVMVRALEGPTNICPTGSCRWSPWLYFQPSGAADTATYQQLTVVKQGPTTGPITISPSTNNGFTAANGNLGLFDAFNVRATATSAWDNIGLSEAFLATASRTPGTAAPADPVQCTSEAPNTPTGCVVYGQGAEMTPGGGRWGVSTSQSSDAFLPLSALQSLSDGLVRVWVHAKDIAGNWGPFTSADLVLDKTPPAVDSFGNATPAVPSTTVTGNLGQLIPAGSKILTVASTAGFPASGSVTVQGIPTRTFTYSGTTPTSLLGLTGQPELTARGAAVRLVVVAGPPVVVLSAHDVLTNGAASGLVGAEWFTGADPGEGKGTPVTVAPTSVSTFPGPANTAAVQSYTLTGLPKGTVHVRVVDAAGNWSAVATGTV